jgi:hypothetical protein
MSVTIEHQPTVHPPHTIKARAPAVAIVGATGAVGVELLRWLEVRGFP